MMTYARLVFLFHLLATVQGFLENATDFDADVFQEVKDIREAYPACMVMPLSRLTVNETGVQNGDITSFGASFLVRNNCS